MSIYWTLPAGKDTICPNAAKGIIDSFRAAHLLSHGANKRITHLGLWLLYLLAETFVIWLSNSWNWTQKIYIKHKCVCLSSRFDITNMSVWSISHLRQDNIDHPFILPAFIISKNWILSIPLTSNTYQTQTIHISVHRLAGVCRGGGGVGGGGDILFI